MKIGNIVSQSKINVSEDINVVQSLDEIIQGLPTLIIGWDYVNKYFPENDVLTKTISDNIFWTFRRNEKRDIHEEDIYNFTNKAYSTLISKLNYVFVDPIHLKTKELKKILKKINSFTNIITYTHDDMVYIYGENLIFGIDLTLFDFVGWDRTKLLDKITNRSNVFLVKNTIFIKYRNRIENLDNQVKYIPFLYYIEHG